MKRVIAAFARNTVFANIILVLIFMAGGFATMSMIRETFPEFSLDMITISVPYPGADPEEVEEGISRKIEEAVEAEEGISQYTTTAAEGVGTALIEDSYPYYPDAAWAPENLGDYALPTFMDYPEEVRWGIEEVPHPAGVKGAKGFSEGSTNGPPPAVMAAAKR